MYDHFQIVAQPAFVLIAPDGSTRRLLGALDEAEFEDDLRELVEPVT